MSNQNYIFKIAQLIEYLKKEPIGTADDLADKINVSRRTFFRYLEELRDLGADIEYCKNTNAYVLKNEFDFLETFFKGVL